MNPLACNYAVARFLPYPETGEFVNVGVVLACPQTGFLGYLMEMKRRARVYKFFPELHREIYAAGLHSFEEQLQYFKKQVGEPPHPGERLLIAREKNVAHLAFAALTRTREALFRFGPPATVLADDPAAKLRELFGHHVLRQFAQDKAYQEKVMTKRLQKMLTTHRINHLYDSARIGTDDYNVFIPFVRFGENKQVAERAIKPLDLNKRGPTEIIEHGDQWIARVSRLGGLGLLPEHMLFTVQVPLEQPQRLAAAQRVVEDLRKLRTQVVPYKDEPAILDFAKAHAA